MVYVLSKTGQPLMPTENHAKARVLLKQQKAKIIHRCPFTVEQNISVCPNCGQKIKFECLKSAQMKKTLDSKEDL